MDAATLAFDRHRPRLKGIAYRMLGSVADAEDVVQDAWLRWNEAAHDALDSAEAWLVTVTTRIVVSDGPATPEQLLGRAEDLSIAFLTVLERLAPEARAAFLLREVFDVDYDEIAQTLGKSEAACRQLVHRAKAQVREDGRPKQAVSREIHLRLLGGFAEAAQRGDLHALKALLAEDVAIVSDGGGKVPSFGQPVVGGQRVAQIYFAVARRFPGAVRVEVADVNGAPGLLRWVDGVLESVQGIEWDGERIARIHAQRNPDKLARIAAEFSI